MARMILTSRMQPGPFSILLPDSLLLGPLLVDTLASASRSRIQRKQLVKGHVANLPGTPGMLASVGRSCWQIQFPLVAIKGSGEGNSPVGLCGAAPWTLFREVPWASAGWLRKEYHTVSFPPEI